MEGKEKMIRDCLNNGVCLSNNYIVSIMAFACFSNNYIVSIMASACLNNNYIFVCYFIHYEKSIIVTAVFNTASVQEL